MKLLLFIVLIFSLPPATRAADCVCVKEHNCETPSDRHLAVSHFGSGEDAEA